MDPFMTALAAALSLQDKAQQYGSYAGIAAVFGLGVLSLLYFAQAREVKRLREWAGRAPERAAELEARAVAAAEERRGAEGERGAGPEPAGAPPRRLGGGRGRPAPGAGAPPPRRFRGGQRLQRGRPARGGARARRARLGSRQACAL